MPTSVALVPLIVVAGLIAATIVARRRGYGVGGTEVVVRCMDGHLFTTIWIPGASLKALRFGPLRLQRCPIGDHLTFVTPVKESDLTCAERSFAHQHHDGLMP